MNVTHSNNSSDNAIVSELRQLRRELADYRQAQREESIALRRLFDRFARVYLESRFPYGKPCDDFSRPRRYG